MFTPCLIICVLQRFQGSLILGADKIAGDKVQSTATKVCIASEWLYDSVFRVKPKDQ